jgi:hypothetical protein
VQLRISRTTALLAGILLPCLETWRRWQMMADWPRWLDDYIAAALLLYAWYAGRRRISHSRAYLMAAWGYTFGIAYMSFFGQLGTPPSAEPSGVPQAAVMAFKGFGLILAAVCLALAWMAGDEAQLPVPAKQ